jgi:hypothetical protein
MKYVEPNVFNSSILKEKTHSILIVPTMEAKDIIYLIQKEHTGSLENVVYTYTKELDEKHLLLRWSEV